MEIVGRLVAKRFEDCLVGELIRYGNNGNVLGILMHRGSDERTNVLCLESSDADVLAFSVDGFYDDGRCASFGTDWVLELLDDAHSRPKNRNAPAQPGDVRVHAETTCMLVTRGAEVIQIRLGDMGVANRTPTEGIPISRWRLWASRNEMESMKAEPVIARL